MSKERDHQPQPLTLENVAQTATEILLAHGTHTPMLMVEGSQHGAIKSLREVAETHEARLQQMFTTGFLMGKRGEIGNLKQVFFITEAWVSTPTSDKPVKVPPSQDPDRKEVLVISHLDVQANESSGVVLEMIRDREGQLTELKSLHEAGGEGQAKQVDNPLLRAFAWGYHSGSTGARGDSS